MVSLLATVQITLDLTNFYIQASHKPQICSSADTDLQHIIIADCVTAWVWVFWHCLALVAHRRFYFFRMHTEEESCRWLHARRDERWKRTQQYGRRMDEWRAVLRVMCRGPQSNYGTTKDRPWTHIELGEGVGRGAWEEGGGGVVTCWSLHHTVVVN